MGRRALRKIDPTLDYSSWFLTEEALPVPLVPADLFGRSEPVEIEVGSGKGLFLDHASAAQPNRSFVGIELAGKYARFTAARLAKRGRTNSKIIHGDGARIFHEVLASHCAAAVHVYFPDPWWKKRHRKRRIMTDQFVRDVARVLQPDGELHFWTDVNEYFDTTLELIERVGGFSAPRFPPAKPAADDLDYRTHFERRVRLHALPVYRARFLKAAIDSTASPSDLND